MDRLSNTSQFMDLAGLDGLRAKAQKDQKAALKEVSQQFEGIFVQMLMKSMRDANAVFEADSPFNSQYTKFYESMHDQQMSVDLSHKGMLGLADLMVQQLSPEGTNMTPASVLRTHEAPAAASISEAPVDSALNVAALNATDKAEKLPTELAAANTQLKLPSSTNAQLKLPQRSDYFPEQQQVESILRGEKSSTQAATEDMRSPESFVKTLYPYAKDAADKLGTTPEVLIAQSALETGWGQKMTKNDNGQSSNNLFNIKAGTRWSGNKATANTTEYEQGRPVSKSENFRVYDSVKDSFDDYVKLISNSDRYQNARQVASDPASFIKGLADAGYATDPNYASKVMRVLHSIKQDISQWGDVSTSSGSVSGAMNYGD